MSYNSSINYILFNIYLNIFLEANDEFVRCTQTSNIESDQRAILWFEDYFARVGDSPPNGHGFHLDITTKKDIYASKLQHLFELTYFCLNLILILK